MFLKNSHGCVHKYEAVFAILWIFKLLLHFDPLFLLTYRVGINYASIINRINYLSENVLCSKNDEIVTGIYLKSLGIR